MQDLFGEDDATQHQEPTLDVTSHAFQPKKYIQRVLAGVPHAVFEGQLVDMVGQAEEDTGEALKQLIRDNLAVFVNSKDAMDAVFHSDQELFTGEALDGITESFKSATNSCDNLVRPITATFVDVQKSRKSQDMLDKLFSVLGVPGAIYECCGAKVALRRVSAIGDVGGSASSNDDADDHDSQEESHQGSDEDEDEEEEDEEDNTNTRGGRKAGKSSSAAAAARRRRSRGGPTSASYGTDSDEEDEEDEENSDGGSDGDVTNPHSAMPSSKAHGTLENPGGTTNLADIYIFAPEEEIYSWYGTPLVRLRDVDERRHHVEEVSNYEAAVLHLRRAMLYVEETYSLIDGTLLAGEDGEAPPPRASATGGGGSEGRHTPSPAANAASTGSAAKAGGTASSAVPLGAATVTSASGFGTVSRSTFAYRFAMALLRSALYLNSQLAEELVYANPADTVLIEDTLSMMMDASIATVKLRHFCGVLQRSIELNKQRKQSLAKLRTQLGGGANGAGETAEGGAGGQRAALNSNPLGALDPSNPSGIFAASSSSGFDPASPPGNNASSNGAARAGPATAAGARRRTPVFQHPAQYFISIVQKQHRHLFYSSAAGLLQEANAWMWKAQTDAARTLEERHRQRNLQRKLRAAAAHGVDTGEEASPLGHTATLGHTFANSFLGASVAADGGFIGNSNDSFLQDTSFGWLNRRRGPSPSPNAQQQQQQMGSPTRGGSSGSPQGLGRSFSGTATGAAATAAAAATSGAIASDAQQYVSLVPEMFVTRILDAFNTPETPFATTTEFRVGSSDMDAVLLSSCLQIRMHAVSLLSQLFTRADVESAVMAQATSLNTFALRLCAECVGTLEHVVGSYWGGIATTLHAGVFDFTPDGTLRTMLMELVQDTNNSSGGGDGGGGADGPASNADGLQRSPSTMLNGGASGEHSRTPSQLGRGDSFSYGQGDSNHAGANKDDNNNNNSNAANIGMSAAGTGVGGAFKVPGSGSGSTDQLPRVRFMPTLPQSLQQTSQTSAGESAKKAADATAGPTCLRDISVQAVHQMISAATNTLQTLFLAFINKGVVDGFVGTMARYRVSDAARYSRTERMELHAAVLYEVLLGQWERMMNLVSDSVLRLKIVMGESSSSATINSDRQVEEVGNLLEELEVLRSTCLRTYMHGVGVLSKAYLTMLPLLQRRSDSSLDARVRSRLSRESVSSNTVHKLLNVLSVVVDRCVPFFTRDAEVYDSVDLFSVKAETLPDDDDGGGDDGGSTRGGGARGGGGGGVTGRRLRLMRSRRGVGGSAASAPSEGGRRDSRGSTALNVSPTPSVGGPDTTTDPVSELLAQFHGKLVVESLQDHEELLLALLSHLLLAFVDTLQLKCRTATTDVSVHPDERERSVVECMADTLSLATTLTPILMEHLLSPCFFELIARQLPEVASSLAETNAYLDGKQQQYVQVYLSVVEEHCQLAVDAMMNTYLALTQQPITDFVRRQGFVQPLFDWQRVSPHTTAAVRPYIADAIACIARAHETLNAIRQPILGSAATQRLVAHLVRVFLTAFTSDVNVFELSVECSSNFLVLGLTLLEAEALTILKVVDAVVAHAAANPTSSELSAELVVAKGSLSGFAQSLDAYANAVCESIAATRGREGASAAAVSLSFLSRDKRHARRDGMVQAAMRTLAYMLEAINVELEESSLSSAGLLQMRSSVTESIVQRLEHRNEGYELRRAKAAQKEQERKDAERRAAAALNSKRKKVVSVVEPPGTAATAGEEAESAGGRRRIVHRRPDGLKPLLPTGNATDADDGDGAGSVVVTPRTAQQHEKETSNALAAASNVFQLAQDQQQKTKVRKVRKVRKAAPALDVGGAEPALPAEAAPVRAAAPRVTPPAQRGVLSGGGSTNNKNNDDDSDQDAEAPVRTRAARRARRGAAANDDADGDGAAEPRERRANRFRRSNVV